MVFNFFRFFAQEKNDRFVGFTKDFFGKKICEEFVDFCHI